MFNIRNRKIIMIGICLLTILSGCATYHGQVDTSVPMVEQVTLIILRPLTLCYVDNYDVSTGLIGWSPAGFATISIPAGEHDLDIEYQSIVIEGGYRYEISGSTTIDYNFEPGFQYTIYAYTEILGAKTNDVDRAIIELSKGFKVAIEKKKKAASSALLAYETGVLMGLSMGPVVRIGLAMGAIPFGLVVDTGKVSFGIDTTISMNFGWRPVHLEDEFKKIFSAYPEGKPMGAYDPMEVDIGIDLGGLFSVYLNQDNGKAFGLGVGGGYSTSLFHLTDDIILNNRNDTPLPKGVWYLRGAIIPNRITKFTIYFDYYLRELTNEIPSNFSYMDDYYNYIITHPRNWYGWGLGIYAKLF